MLQFNTNGPYTCTCTTWRQAPLQKQISSRKRIDTRPAVHQTVSYLYQNVGGAFINNCVTPPVSHPTPSEINIAITQLQFTTRLGFLRVLDGSQWKAGLGRERGCFLRNIGEAFRLKPAEEDCGKSGWGSSCETWRRSVWGVGGEFRMKHGRVGSCEAFREASCEARRGGL